MGGTFTARDVEYQEYFIKRCFDALNVVAAAPAVEYSSESLEAAQLRNETAAARCTGLTIETRPDCCKPEHVDLILKLGGTRVELGVQTIYDEILAAVERGHDVAATIKATRTLKDAGLKVCYHIMPGLPCSTRAKDLEVFRRLFTDGAFKPDMLKIYPTLVTRGTKLYELWKAGEYSPLSTEEAIELLAKVKAKYLPRWVRVQRIQRDIPVKLIEAGVKKAIFGGLSSKN
jgi:elongator complex protein 3